MIRLFMENRIWVLLLLPLVISVYLLLSYNTEYYVNYNKVNLGLWKSHKFNTSYFGSISVFIVLSNAIGLNALFNINEFFEKNIYVIALLYILLMSFYNSFYSLNGLLISHSLMILMLYQFFKLKQNEDGRSRVFNASLFAGIATTFYPPLVISFPLLVVIILIIRPFYIREMVVCFFGFITPFIFLAVYLWCYNYAIFEISADYKLNYQLQTDYLLVISIFSILFILSFLGLSTRLLKSSIRFKKQIQIVFVFVVLALMLGFLDLFTNKQIESFSLLLIPLSMIFSYSLYHKYYGIISTIFIYLIMLYSVLKFFIFSPQYSM